MRLLLLSALLVTGTVVSGCGSSDAPQLANATGTVLYKGQPVAGATVTFLVPKSPIASGTTDAEGKFTLTTGGSPGVALGSATVGIAKFATSGEDKTKMTPADMAKMAEKSKMASTKPKAEIPVKYANPETSTLTATIDADETKNVFKFELVD
jgi:hypothetical protein